MQPDTPACRLPKGTRDPGFRTKPQQAAELVQAARTAGIPFRAVVADCFYGDNAGFCAALGRAGEAFVLQVRPRKGVWAPAEAAHTPREAAAELAWTSPKEPGDWTKVTRGFRDGYTQTWWAADARLGAAGWGPDRRLRLVVATTDPARLPKLRHHAVAGAAAVRPSAAGAAGIAVLRLPDPVDPDALGGGPVGPAGAAWLMPTLIPVRGRLPSRHARLHASPQATGGERPGRRQGADGAVAGPGRADGGPAAPPDPAAASPRRLDLLDEAAFARDQYLPYWAQLWPSGLALPSIAAALPGARALATDWSSDAVVFAATNAARNNVPVATDGW